MSSFSYTLGQLAQQINAELVGDPDRIITSLATLQSATHTQLSFIANPAYKKYLEGTHAGAVIVNPDLAEFVSTAKLIVSNPYLAYATLTQLFEPYPSVYTGIHPQAIIGQNVKFGEGVSIAAGAVIGAGASIGAGSIIGAGSVVGEDCVIGDRSCLKANVTLYPGVVMGADCVIHSGAVLGADGFGFAPTKEGWVKIHQLGSVIVGDSVEIGANTTIDRGALDNTVIESGVIIDNLVQIGHNVRLGKNTAIAAHTAIAGSTQIGANCTIAGAVAIAGHLTIADNVHVTGMSMVSASLTEAGSYSSGVPLGPTKEWRKNAARFRQLDTLAQRLIGLERRSKSEAE